MYFVGISVSWNTSLNKNKNPPVDLKITEVPGPSTREEEKQTENDAVPFHFSNSLSTSHQLGPIVTFLTTNEIADRVDSYWNDWIHQWTFTEQQIILLHLNSVQMENIFCLLWHKEYCFRVEASTSTSFILFLDIENTQQPFMGTVDSSHTFKLFKSHSVHYSLQSHGIPDVNIL